MAYATVNASGSGDNTIISATAGKRYVVTAYTIVAQGDVVATWKSGSSTSISGPLSFAADGDGGGASCDGGLFRTSLGEALVLNLDAAVTVGGHVTYYEDAQ